MTPPTWSRAVLVASLILLLPAFASAASYQYHYEVWAEAIVVGTVTLELDGQPFLEVSNVHSFTHSHFETGSTCRSGVGEYYNYRDATFDDQVMGQADGFVGAVWTYAGMTFYSGSWQIDVDSPGEGPTFSDRPMQVHLGGGYAEPEPWALLGYLGRLMDDYTYASSPELVDKAPMGTATTTGTAEEAIVIGDLEGIIPRIRLGDTVQAHYEAEGNAHGLVHLKAPTPC